MKVFEFGVEGGNCKEWIVAESISSAFQLASDECDLLHLDDGDSLTIKMLTDAELETKKYDPDPEGTGEFDFERAITFNQALKSKSLVKTIPFLLCSFID